MRRELYLLDPRPGGLLLCLSLLWRIKEPCNIRSVVHWRPDSLGRLSCLSLSGMGMAHDGPCPISRHLAASSLPSSEMNHRPLKTHIDR